LEINKKINILLVDDRFENLLSLEALLDSPSYTIVKAQSGEEALKYLLRDDYAVILLDVQMPGMDGFETARLIKGRKRSREIPIIFVTAINKEAEHVYSGYEAGAIDYIFKPLDSLTICAKVQGFVNLFLRNQRVVSYAEALKRKTDELQIACKDMNRAIEKLRKTEALARLIGESSLDSILLFNESGNILTMNPATKLMFGPSAAELLYQPVERILPSISRKTKDYPACRRFELNALRLDNSTFPAEIQIGEASLDDQRIFVCTTRDITERKAHIFELEYRAEHDELTGLGKRALLYNRMSEIIAKRDDTWRTFALCILDLDRFKIINDTFGHDCGDVLLRQVATRLKKSIGERNTAVRLGGDEFAVLMPGICIDEYVQQLEEIQKIFDKPFRIDGKHYDIRASVGVAHYPADGRDIQSLMRKADAAMYKVKRNRRKTVGIPINQEKQILNRENDFVSRI
jgi:diguanylate cyclase (GGDEF)-like protein/PAS domain S-box-containing protein